MTLHYPKSKNPDQSASLTEYQLLRKARDEHATHIIQPLNSRPRRAAQDLLHDNKGRYLIDFDMCATAGDLRNYMKEHPAVRFTQKFVVCVRLQVLYGL